MPAKVIWLGDLVGEKLAVEAAEAINVVTKAAADDAKGSHWWTARRGSEGLEGQVVAEPARPEDGFRITGRFGSSLRSAGFYGLFLELKEPWLRPAADRHFPALAALIRARRRV